MNLEERNALFKEIMMLNELQATKLLGRVFGYFEVKEEVGDNVSPEAFFKKLDEIMDDLKQKEKQ